MDIKMPGEIASPANVVRHAMKYLPVLVAVLLPLVSSSGGERLPNGIVLPDEWPPHPAEFAREAPQPPPYLLDPPKVIHVNVGRQLFVDDFLIEQTDLKRTFHQPQWHPDTPVFKAETPWEFHRNYKVPFAAPFSDGVWHDPKDGLFKMWYLAGSGVAFGYATSTDGVHWERPVLNAKLVGGENIIDIGTLSRDSSTIWLDQETADPATRFKLFYFRAGLHMRTSADGIRWSADLGSPGPSSDRSTMFYNPFRKVWVYGIRSSRKGVGRCRYYAENREFGVPNQWKRIDELSRWACAGSLDRVKPVTYVDDLPDLYNLDATPYESLMLGLFTIHAKVTEGPRPKINYVTLGYSRDGFHWSRPDRRPFLDVSDDPKAWNYGNVQSAGGGCLVVGDQLYFYCSGRNSGRDPDDGSGGSTGLAILRRDGFASLDAGSAEGIVTTRPLTFTGKQLFVNVAAAKGELRAELLDAGGNPLPPFTRDNCEAMTLDSTRAEVRWKGVSDLSAHAGKPVRLRFHLRGGSLYSFWISPDASGASHGYLAAGGPGHAGTRDTEGAK